MPLAQTTIQHLASETIAFRATTETGAVTVLLNAGDQPFRFLVSINGLTPALAPEPGKNPADPALVPAHSWIILASVA